MPDFQLNSFLGTSQLYLQIVMATKRITNNSYSRGMFFNNFFYFVMILMLISCVLFCAWDLCLQTAYALLLQIRFLDSLVRTKQGCSKVIKENSTSYFSLVSKCFVGFFNVFFGFFFVGGFVFLCLFCGVIFFPPLFSTFGTLVVLSDCC